MKGWIRLRGVAGNWDPHPELPFVPQAPHGLPIDASVHIYAPFSSVLARSFYLCILLMTPVASQPPQIATGWCVSWQISGEKSDWPSVSEPGHMHHRPMLSQCIGLFLVSCSLILSVEAHAFRVTWQVRTTSCRPVDRVGFLEKEQEYLVKSAWKLTMVLLAALLIEYCWQGLDPREAGRPEHCWSLPASSPMQLKMVTQGRCIFPSVLWLLREDRGKHAGEGLWAQGNGWPSGEKAF